MKTRNAFTMIELIFVIVILGILAAVAVPKLAATRNDARVAADVTSAAQCLQNLAVEHVSKGSFTNYTVPDANKAVKCFTFTLNNATEGNITVSARTIATSDCPQGVLDAAKIKAENNGIINADGSAKTYVFTGAGVKE